MPIYEYRCSACGHELEALQKFSDAKLLTCPACNADTLVKKVSAAGFQLKGSGWYVTDFRNGSKSSAALKPDAAAEGDAAKSKPEAGATDAKGDTPAKSESASAKESKDSKGSTPAPAPAAAKAESAPAKPASTPTGGSSST